MAIDIKKLLQTVGLGAASVGAVGLNIATGGASAPLTDQILKTIGAALPNPALQAQLEQARLLAQADLEKAELAYTQNVITAVNATMQAEAKSDSWLQKSWRPMFGFGTLFVIVNNYALVTYLSHWNIHPVVIPGDVWNVMLAVLGLSAMTRGIEKITDSAKGN